MTRRQLMQSTAFHAAAKDPYGAAVRALRVPLGQSEWPRDLIRCATLAANSHNTQPWKFKLASDTITIHPDSTRRTPVVDPDDHHLWVSLGCAVENLVLAAGALGKQASVTFAGQRVEVALRNAAPMQCSLVNAIFERQCTRNEYDGQPLPNPVLQQLERASGNRLLLLTERDKLEGVIEYVVQGNGAQIHDASFEKELKSWLRFNEADALASGDGLFTRLSGYSALPHWLGDALFSLFLSEKRDNAQYSKKIRSSAGVAIFVSERADPEHWFETGRAYQRFALTATTLGVSTAFVNQPAEVPAVRAQFARWLGLGTIRPDLVVRFGRGLLMPYSLRRPLKDVIL